MTTAHRTYRYSCGSCVRIQCICDWRSLSLLVSERGHADFDATLRFLAVAHLHESGVMAVIAGGQERFESAGRDVTPE